MRQLIQTLTKKDFDIQTFYSGGKGGQNQNKRETGVRIIHKESGAVGESRTERSQYLNKRLAFKRLTESAKFKIWLSKLTLNQTSIEETVNKQMNDVNLRIETLNSEGTWETI